MNARRTRLDAVLARLSPIADTVRRLPFVGVLVRAGSKALMDRSKDMAASIAFFTFLSLFPLILGLLAISGFFLTSDAVQDWLRNFLIEILPSSAEFLMGNIESLIRMRGAAGIASVLLLFWSASKMVGALGRGINNALEFKRPYAAYLSPIRNLALTLAVTFLVLVTMAFAPLIEILADLDLGIIGRRWRAFFNVAASHVSGIAISIFMMYAIYWLVPYKRLPLRELLPGILVAAIAMKLGKELFALYVSNASRFDVVYGSVSSIIVLLIWLYFSALVVLYSTEVICVYRASRNDLVVRDPHEHDEGPRDGV